MESGELHRSTRSHHQRSESLIQFSHSDKFFCKLLEKESDGSIHREHNPSFRVYYGGSKGSVPFFWEMTPGTPKHTLSLDNDGPAQIVAPPLTPPPRYLSNGSGRESVKRGPRKVLEGFVRSTKMHVLNLKYLSKSQWSSALGRKAPSHLRTWRSMHVVPFWTPVGEGNEGILNKTTSFGRCFRSSAE